MSDPETPPTDAAPTGAAATDAALKDAALKDAAPLRVLFVCTANIARSPYAERRARALLAEGGAAGIEVASAGVRALNGHAMDDEMAAQLAQRGASGEGHISHRVRPDLLESVDLVLTFEFGQHMRLVDEWPQHAPRIFGFSQFVAGVRELPRRWATDEAVAQVRVMAPPDSMSLDVMDPHGRGRRAAASCAQEIDAGLGVLVPFLAAARHGVHQEPAGEDPATDAVGAVEPPGNADHAYAEPDAAPRHALAFDPAASVARPRGSALTSLIAAGIVALLGGGLALVAAVPASAAWWVGMVAAGTGAVAASVGGLGWWRALRRGA